jgi:hypothetical protein
MLSRLARGLCFVLAVASVLTLTSRWATGTPAVPPDGEEILLTSVPENTLNLQIFSCGIEGLGPIAPAGFAPQPAVQTPVRAGFWTAAESGLFTASLVSFAAMNVADFFLTREAMKYPGMSETNPLIRPIVKNDFTFALYKTGYVALTSYLLGRLHASDKPLAWALSLASNLLISLAVSHNIGQLDKVKGR